MPGFGVFTAEARLDESPNAYFFRPVGFTNTSQEDVRLWLDNERPVVVPAGSSWTGDYVLDYRFDVYLSRGSSFARVAASCILIGSTSTGYVDLIAQGTIVD